MRDPIPDFLPAKTRIYGSFISNLDLSINGLKLDKQTSRQGLKGNWVRVLVTDVDCVRYFSFFTPSKGVHMKSRMLTENV